MEELYVHFESGRRQLIEVGDRWMRIVVQDTAHFMVERGVSG